MIVSKSTDKVLGIHGIGDDIVPYQNAQIVYDDFLNNGAENVELILFPEFVNAKNEQCSLS